MSSGQEQVDQRYKEWIERFVGGGVDRGRNPDGTPEPAEIHFGHALVNDKADPVPFSYALPFQLSAHLSKAKAAYIVFGKASNSTREKKIKVDFDKDFNFMTLRAFLPGMHLGWHNYDYQLGSRRSVRTMVMSAVGSYHLSAAHSVRVGEGCDRYGNPFPDDEPVVGTRDYNERKDLRDQYRVDTLSYGDYMIKLQALFKDRSLDREPLLISSGVIRDDGEDPQQCAFIDFRGCEKADQIAQFKIEPLEFRGMPRIHLQLVFRRLVPSDIPQEATTLAEEYGRWRHPFRSFSQEPQSRLLYNPSYVELLHYIYGLQIPTPICPKLTQFIPVDPNVLSRLLRDTLQEDS